MKSIGALLQGSGWTSALVEAGIATAGTAESFLSACSISKTRQAHQITSACLYKLLKTAYSHYCSKLSDSDYAGVKSLEEWCHIRQEESPLFQFWYLVLAMELSILTFIRSIREGNFQLYCDVLYELIPHFFANNNINYARWLPSHLQDMLSIEKHHPVVGSEFRNGNFVIHKSNRE